MRFIASLLIAFFLPIPVAQAQDFDRKAAERQRRNGIILSISGGVLTTTGIAGMVYGANAKWYQSPSFSTCHPAVAQMYYPENLTVCRPTVPAEKVASWPIVYAGAGATLTGIVMMWRGSKARTQGRERLKELDALGGKQAWSFSWSATSARVAYRW